ncbi:AbrB/MazE/SpoVT family DNA-binding domain-containing protein [Vineibacter terrae]|uniref:AbrB/MazE/SpoVT family DNA-binding domain-containing protein n=1 Tax=Vineibacter terrae TaxID=2586908 RepID=UPI002E31ADB8|nr:AbrB/MazE/SpoVT family DNA-binding domain-containing protein [Vineibacter terrae]HEX2891296.1 AbrB/MazE/SpoVT family DNA-binding domain-containing protein [Vineibacter terrae]
MRVIVKKWGNSAAVRIPAAVMAAASLAVDDVVDVREVGGRIVIEPVRRDELATLVDGITLENLHGDVSFGRAVGKEPF